MSAPSPHKIYISPIRIYDSELINEIGEVLHKTFGYPVEVYPLLQDISFAYYPGRTQYNSSEILKKLEALCPEGVIKVLAVTGVDLFIPILTYVYGEAQLGGRASIISTHRLAGTGKSLMDGKSFWSRVTKEAVHELGHTFMLRHCEDPLCIMHYCRSIEDVDRKSNSLCRYCRILLDDAKKRLAGNVPPAE